MAGAKDKTKRIEGPDGKAFGPCSDCIFYRDDELQLAGKGRCHGAPPSGGMFPGVAGSTVGCGFFRSIR